MFSDISFLVAELNQTLSQKIRCLDKEHHTNEEIQLYARKQGGLLKAYSGRNDLPNFVKTLGLTQDLTDLQISLRIACSLSHSDIIGALLDDGRVDLSDHILILWICKNGCADILRKIIHMNIRFNFNDNEPFRIAAALGKTEIVELLLDYVNPCDLKNEAFRKACRNGHTAVVKLILNSGRRIDVNDCDNEALLYAAAGGHHEIVKILLDIPTIFANVHHNLPLRWAFVHYQMYPKNVGIQTTIQLLLSDSRVRGMPIPDYIKQTASLQQLLLECLPL